MVIPREPDNLVSGLRRDYTPAPQISKAYLLGLLHDATERRTTFRISTNNFVFSKFLKKGINNLGSGAWIYKEGRARNIWIVEFSKKLLSNFLIRSKSEKRDYIRGYFDSEGGVPKSSNVRFYIYFSQKNRKDLLEVKSFLEEFGIASGVIHNPSKKVDPNYWRFFIRAKSYTEFCIKVGSFHTEKSKYLRMKI